jgi:hypothetical protein
MNCQTMKMPELEERRVALLKKINEENLPENSVIRGELQDVENWIKLGKKEQEPASKTYRFQVGS